MLTIFGILALVAFMATVVSVGRDHYCSRPRILAGTHADVSDRQTQQYFPLRLS